MATAAVAAPVPAWSEPAGYCEAGYVSGRCPWEDRTTAEKAACHPDVEDVSERSTSYTSTCSEPGGEDLDASMIVDHTDMLVESKVLTAIARALARAVARNKQACGPGRPRATRFDGKYAPQITIIDYILRLVECFQCTQECCLLAMVYIDRVLVEHPDVDVTALSVHRLILASVVVAAKFHDDVFFTNAFYAEVGGVNIMELNSLEVRLLDLLGWRTRVSPEEYARCFQGIDDWVGRGAGTFGTLG